MDTSGLHSNLPLQRSVTWPKDLGASIRGELEEHHVLWILGNLSFLLNTRLAGRLEAVNLPTLELTGAFLSMGLMTNFLSLKEMFLISLQGKPIFGVNLRL